jgi:hypothetical protein
MWARTPADIYMYCLVLPPALKATFDFCPFRAPPRNYGSEHKSDGCVKPLKAIHGKIMSNMIHTSNLIPWPTLIMVDTTMSSVPFQLKDICPNALLQVMCSMINMQLYDVSR